MNISTVDKVGDYQKAMEKATPADLRRVATEFEALLLTQLTSSLNKTGYEESDGDDEPLFGGDGGTDLAKQLFSEQLAKTMAQAGGFGLANVIMRQFGLEAEKAGVKGIKGLDQAISAIKDIKSDASPRSFPLINRSAKAEPLAKLEFAGNPNDAEVISTFEDQARSEGIEESLRNLILDGRIVNTTRSRLAPNAPVTLDSGVSVTKAAASRPLEYRYPVAGRLTSDIGNRVHPIDRKVKFHAGLDLAVPPGTSVGASADGVVSFAGWSGGYGNLLVVKHMDGRETRYGHLNKLLVKEGDAVSAGQVVALSGSTGKSTGPHVHFEIRENGQVLNPLNILTKGLE
ncbi:MAG: peptidoglycan DD-metalloendopeptidase family protein [Pyrinomonadaceae bacterium]